MKMIGEIKLNKYDASYDSVLMQFSLPLEQAQFTGMPDEMVRKAKEDTSRNPIVITHDSQPVGFFVLCTGELVSEYTPNQQALLLIAFSINHSEQGKGYAKVGLQLLSGFIAEHFPEKNEVVLAVNGKNKPAQRLYKKVGFKDTGRRKVGKIGEQMILSLHL
ncbi:GNAT family N-acetyltransferase [Sutcliffiella halmapala]|uniref:GNAT family N-acetyltransferase n=1 Tax=Sutcliffiella halmapala TaxID=79882 RepID=UPI000995149C|nr:GNAT family N-acetyltransferase [Sutcliffiella halmapala]